MLAPFLLLACDGVFESMPNDAAVALVARRLSGGCSPAQAAAVLVDACLGGRGGGWGSDRGDDTRSRDNITALIVDLGDSGEEDEDEEDEEEETQVRRVQGA